MKLRIFISFYIQIIEIYVRDDWNIETSKGPQLPYDRAKILTIKYCHQSVIQCSELK